MCEYKISSFYIRGYTLKTKYRNLAILTIFVFSLLAIETLQSLFLRKIISLFGEISLVKNKAVDY